MRLDWLLSWVINSLCLHSGCSVVVLDEVDLIHVAAIGISYSCWLLVLDFWYWRRLLLGLNESDGMEMVSSIERATAHCLIIYSESVFRNLDWKEYIDALKTIFYQKSNFKIFSTLLTSKSTKNKYQQFENSSRAIFVASRKIFRKSKFPAPKNQRY